MCISSFGAPVDRLDLLHHRNVFNILQSAFKIQVLSMSAIKCQGKFQNFHFSSAIRRQKSCQRVNRNLCILCWQLLQHSSASFQVLWFSFFNCWDYLLYLNYIVHLYYTWNGRQCFSCWSPCFGFFVCPCYSRRTHPMLEKPGAQNIAACEN